MTDEFKPGDRVEVLPKFDGDLDVGLATVDGYQQGGRFVSVSPDGRLGYWWCYPKHLRKIDDQKPKADTEAERRKGQPVARGVLDYFPDALLAVAELSRIGNEQHNPGQPMHWAKEKSTDHADCILRHLIDRGTMDTDGVSHTVKVAWRALALLQTEIEAADPALKAKRARK